MKIKKSMIGILTAMAALATALTGCGDKADETTVPKGTDSTSTEAMSGSLLLAGSTSMETLVTAAQEAFMDLYPDVSVNSEFIGSGAGVESVLAGTSDIGNSSRALKDSEKAEGAVENIVALDGIAIIVDPTNEIENLTKDQLIGIYTGATTNWSDLGGKEQPIVVVGRESGSGTRAAFEEILEITDQCMYANELDNTGAVMAKVASTKGAIGYVSLDVVDDSVKTMNLEGVEATAQNIKAGSYFLSRPFVMATKGEISEQNKIVQAWFEFLQSEEGTTLIKEVGLIPIEKEEG